MVADTCPAVSVILPVFNGEPHLGQQLRSIVGQSWRDFELLIQDDGSTDGSLAIARQFARADPRIRVLDSQGNIGQKLRLVELVRASRAPLLAISDQDDIWHEDKLQRLTKSLGDGAMVFGRSELIDAEGRSFGCDLLDVTGTSRVGGERLSLLFRPQVSGHALLARREVFTEAAFNSPEPYDWLLSLNAEFSRGIVYDAGAIVFHRMHRANSYNDTVVARMNPLWIRPRHVLKAAKRLGGRRARFVAAMEFLSQSEMIPRHAQARFRQVADQSRAAWFPPRDSGRPTVLPLQRCILRTLQPFAASRRDWQITVSKVRSLTLVPFT